MSALKFFKEAILWANAGGPKTVGMPYILGQSFIPVIHVPNGTVAVGGAITLVTALPAVYANAWVYLPAGAISGGLAGVYFCKFSSTTVGQVYTNYVNTATTAFSPTIPGTQTNAVGSGAAYTQVTAADCPVLYVTLPASAMGANGSVRFHPKVACNNTANNRTISLKLAATVAMSKVLASVTATSPTLSICNRGVQNSQVGEMATSDQTFATASAFTYPGVDTSVAQALTFTSNLSTATDYVVLEGYSLEVLPKL